jgi:hypothetical protein
MKLEGRIFRANLMLREFTVEQADTGEKFVPPDRTLPQPGDTDPALADQEHPRIRPLSSDNFLCRIIWRSDQV